MKYVHVLESQRLSLCPLGPDDLVPMHGIWNDPDVRRYLWDDKPVSVEEAEACFVQSAREFAEEGFGMFGVRPRDETGLIGFCGLRCVEGTREVELMYGLLPEWWGRGFATEAARACLRFAFEEVGLERVLAGTDLPNTASSRVMKKLGMTFYEEIQAGEHKVSYFALRREDWFGESRTSRGQDEG